MTAAVEKRREAIDKIASYWGLSLPRCMWPEGCVETDLQIGHIYGGGWKERMAGVWSGKDIAERRTATAKFRPPQLYWSIVSGEYELAHLNLLCPKHNRGWWIIETVLRFKQWLYRYPDESLMSRVFAVFETEHPALEKFLEREEEEWKSLKLGN